MRRTALTAAAIVLVVTAPLIGQSGPARSIKCSPFAQRVLSTLAATRVGRSDFPTPKFDLGKDELLLDGEPGINAGLERLVAVFETRKPGLVEFNDILSIYFFGEELEVSAVSLAIGFREFLGAVPRNLPSASTGTDSSDVHADRSDPSRQAYCVVAGSPEEVRILRGVAAACRAYAGAQKGR